MSISHGRIRKRAVYGGGLLLAPENPNIKPTAISAASQLASVLADRIRVKVMAAGKQQGWRIPTSELRTMLAREDEPHADTRKANVIPSSAPAAAIWASRAWDFSQLPNLAVRQARRSMPWGGICGFNWNGFQFTLTPDGLPSSFNALSSRRLPMKHHGQITSETMSMVSVPGEGTELGDVGPPAVEQALSVQAGFRSVMVVRLLLVQHLTYFSQQDHRRVRFLKKRDFRLQDAVTHHGVIRVAAHVEHLHLRHEGTQCLG